MKVKLMFIPAKNIINIRMSKFKSLLAFTLAEVLIVLGIIGIVAETTIPTVLDNFQSQQTTVSLKKAYSELSQAYNRAVQDNGTPDNWSLGTIGSQSGATNILNTMAQYLILSKNCGSTAGCFYSGAYKQLNNATFDTLDQAIDRANAILADGTSVTFYTFGDCTTHASGTTLPLTYICGNIGVDINGAKKPNVMGIDYFLFYFTKYGIIPYGTQQDSIRLFSSRCKDKTTQDGAACAAWVLYNENNDYLKCNNLDWNGPTKCN